MLPDYSMHLVGGDIDNITIEMVAQSLAYTNRYNGFFGAYSVAQHSVLVSRRCPDVFKLSGLLHDAPEMILSDVTSPVKNEMTRGDYKALEDHYHRAFDDKLNVQTRHFEVKEIDLRMLVTEARSFGCPLDHFPPVEPYDFKVDIWPAEAAKEAFLNKYRELTK